MTAFWNKNRKKRTATNTELSFGVLNGNLYAILKSPRQSQFFFQKSISDQFFADSQLVELV